MEDRILLQDKPSRTEIVFYWPTVGFLLLGSLALPAYFFQSLSLLSQMFTLLELGTLGLIALRLIYDLIDREFTTYTLTEKNLVKNFGILIQRQTTIPLNKIQLVFIKQSFVSKLLGFGTLVITTGGVGIVTVKRVPRPEKWNQAILNQMGQPLAVEISRR